MEESIKTKKENRWLKTWVQNNSQRLVFETERE